MWTGLRMFTYHAAIVTLANRPKKYGQFEHAFLFIYLRARHAVYFRCFRFGVSRKQKPPLPKWPMRSLAASWLGITAKKRYTP